MMIPLACILCCLLIAGTVKCQNDAYDVGFGIADVTGPAAEINMMGYAKPEQDTHGLHTRLYSRAVIIRDLATKKRVVFVNAELCSLTDIVKMMVIDELSKHFGEELYHHENIMMTATHTHSGPGGYFQYLLYLVTAEGFQHQSFKAIVDGVTLSIIRAHNKLKPATIRFSVGELLHASINRSPTAYFNNPNEERQQYQYDTDKTMQLLAFHDREGHPLGILNWFAVHGTSMNNTNRLISSDNKGYASYRFEKDFMSSGNVSLEQRNFVAIFAQSNEGDSSPNIQGAKCQGSGLPCNIYTSTCPKNDLCIASGPGKDMFESTQIIGDAQYRKARELMTNATKVVSGSVEYIHQNVNMSGHMFELENGTVYQTCVPALGYSFAAGTTDGEGATYFRQGTTTESQSKILSIIRNFLVPMSRKEINCHNPKAVLLPVGKMTFPYDWVADIVPTQIFQIGDIIILGVPAEFTTMAGRRIIADVRRIYEENGQKVHVILSGLANSYTNYVTTFEEYQIQRYEGGSTLFGPHTLEAYQAQYRHLAKNLVKKQPVPAGPRIPNLLSKQSDWKLGVMFDNDIMQTFGQVVSDARAQYRRGEKVTVKYFGANPRNNLHLEGTFLEVHHRPSSAFPWTIYATDADWSTKFFWERLSFGRSEVTITWDISQDTPPGEYKIVYYGDAKHLLVSKAEAFHGESRTFKVI